MFFCNPYAIISGWMLKEKKPITFISSNQALFYTHSIHNPFPRNHPEQHLFILDCSFRIYLLKRKKSIKIYYSENRDGSIYP